MNKNFNMKNFFTLLFPISIYLIFVILFWNVLQGKDFNIGLRTIPLLIVSIIFLAWISRYFFNYTTNTLSNRKIFIILATAITFSLSLQTIIHIPETSETSGKKFSNPLYRKFVSLGNKNGLDLSFTKIVWVQRGPNNYKINTIFEEKEKSIDILFLGDSSIAWGLIPKVIEQMTGKKVAVYAYESNVLTEKTSKLFNKISEYYLKDNGLVIFSFDNWTLTKDPSFVKISKKQCDEIISWQEKDFIAYATQNEKSFYQKYLSYSAFQSLYNEKSEYLKTKYGLHLKSPSFYEEYIEPIINPVLHVTKSVNKNEKTKFMRWDMDSITEYNLEFKSKSLYSEIMPKRPMVNKNVEINAKAASNIYGKNKIYMVPLFNNNNSYKTSRNIYYTYYKKLGFKLSDLGLFQPKKDGYTMQAKSHMGNEGGLMKSILIGKWLKRYFNDDTISHISNIEYDLLKIYKEKYDKLLANTPDNSNLYLSEEWLNDEVIKYMKNNNRYILSNVKNNKDTFYFMEGSIDSTQLKNYQLTPIGSNTLSSHLKQYSKDTIILSIKDEGFRMLSTDTKQYFKNLGIKIDKLYSRGSFAALIDNNTTIIYDINNTAEVGLNTKVLSKFGIQKITSSGYKNGNKSEIIINNKNYSKQHRGINYVIKKKNGTILNGYVDTHLKDQVRDLIFKATPMELKSKK